MAQSSPFEDYHVGQVLTLIILPGYSELGSASSTCQARIRQLLTPRTLSCCMVVDLVHEASPHFPTKPGQSLFLKLFDRRFSDGLRQDCGIGLWTKKAEHAFIETVRTGAACAFLHKLETDSNFEEDTEETWDDDQNETYLADKANDLFNNETKAYDALRNVQGNKVPRLMAAVQLAVSIPNANTGVLNTITNITNPANADTGGTDAAGVDDLLGIKGLLLQYIDGFSLAEVQDHAPRSTWQDIVDQAVAAVHAASDCNILNEDVRPANFMVQRKDDDGYHVIMVDFAITRLREPEESDHDWANAKLTKDEEGAVALVMKKRLAAEGFELQYEDSERYWEAAGSPEE